MKKILIIIILIISMFGCNENEYEYEYKPDFSFGGRCGLRSGLALITGDKKTAAEWAEAVYYDWPRGVHVAWVMNEYKMDNMEYWRSTDIGPNICQEIKQWMEEGRRVVIDYRQGEGNPAHSEYIETWEECIDKDIYIVNVAWFVEEWK